MKLRSTFLIALCLMSAMVVGCGTVENQQIMGVGTYSGTTFGGKPHGNGKLESLDGRVYEGQFQEGLAHGFGTVTAQDGSSYTGQFLYGFPIYQGFITRPDGKQFPVNPSMVDGGSYTPTSGLSAEDQVWIENTIIVNTPSINW